MAAGIKWLLESHTDIYSKKQVYDMINMEGVTEYGQSFQVIEVCTLCLIY